MKEYFQIAFKNLSSRRLRSYLTVIGIIIGVFLIVSLLSLSEGLKEAVMTQLRMYGANTLYIFPGSLEDINSILGFFMGRLEIEDRTLEKIKKIEEVEKVVPFDYRAEVVRYKNKAKTVLIFAYPREEGQEIFRNEAGWKLIEGEWPKKKKKEVLVGRLVPIDIFPGLKTGDKIYIKGKEFLVKGVLHSLGSKQDDSMIEMELEHFREITGLHGGCPFALVKISPTANQENLALKIKRVLQENQKRKVGGEELEFTVLTNERVSSIASSILLILQIFIGIFASIALLVGGIGIMNTMFTSVRERTREIGIMKAIGAKNSEILFIFLVEAGILGVIGGIGGTILGLLFAKGVEFYGQVHPIFYFKASINLKLIIFSILFSLGIGCLSGFLPAKRAASLRPTDALRYFE